MDPNTYNAVKSVFDPQGVPEYVWYPILQLESGGDPRAVGDNGVSIGLFQLNTAGGQGTGYNKDYLKDPVINAEIASRAIAPAYHAVENQFLPSDMAGQVAIRSGHPGGSISRPLQGQAADRAVRRLDVLSRSFLGGQSAASRAIDQAGGAGAGSSSGGGGIGIPNPLDEIGRGLSGVNDFFKGLNEALSHIDPIGIGIAFVGVVVLVLVIASVVFEKSAPAIAPIAKAAITKGAL